jgi:hypothetical protein
MTTATAVRLTWSASGWRCCGRRRCGRLSGRAIGRARFCNWTGVRCRRGPSLPAARRRLRGGQGHADPGAAPTPDVVQQRTPPAAEVEHAPPRPDSDLLGHEGVLAPLSLFETQRKVAVVLGSAEIRQLTQAEPEDTIDQRIGELEVLALGHGLEGICFSSRCWWVAGRSIETPEDRMYWLHAGRRGGLRDGDVPACALIDPRPGHLSHCRWAGAREGLLKGIDERLAPQT